MCSMERCRRLSASILRLSSSIRTTSLSLTPSGICTCGKNRFLEANKYFSHVAESYVRNNFFLKALAVYKKILSADPNNLEINATMASLYAKQGLSIDARNQYLKIVALLENAGRSGEILEIFEKIVELDPGNVTIQQKLAELYYAAGDDKQAHTCWTAAARAQLKAGDVAGAMDSIRRAIELDPLDGKAIGSLLECCRKSGDFNPVLDQLKKSINLAPQNLDMREMLGQAYLETNDPEMAAKAFQAVFSMDESRYEGFFAVAQALINKDDCDQAANILDTVIPILITRRETERAAELFGQILHRRPTHIFSMNQMASIYSATGDQSSLSGNAGQNCRSLHGDKQSRRGARVSRKDHPGESRERKTPETASAGFYRSLPG